MAVGGPAFHRVTGGFSRAQGYSASGRDNRPGQGYRRHAFTLIEMVTALAIVAVALLIFGVTIPVAFRGAGQGRTYTQAALLAQHKVDQLRQAGFNNLNYATLLTLGVIDAAKNADGTFAFTTVDHLADSGSVKGYFGAGTVTSSILIGQALPQLGASAPSTLKAYQVSVTIAWAASSGIKAGSFTTHSIIAAP